MNNISGWWFQPTPLKNDGVKVNRKDDIPYMKWKIKVMFQTTNQFGSVEERNGFIGIRPIKLNGFLKLLNGDFFT